MIKIGSNKINTKNLPGAKEVSFLRLCCIKILKMLFDHVPVNVFHHERGTCVLKKKQLYSAKYTVRIKHIKQRLIIDNTYVHVQIYNMYAHKYK